MAHTPGPWVAIRQRGRYEGNYNIGRAEDVGKGPLLTFASIFGPNDICPPEYAEAAEANAMLMAAAPKLLEALDLIGRIANLESGELSQEEWDEYIAPFTRGRRSSEASMIAILDAIQAITRTASEAVRGEG